MLDLIFGKEIDFECDSFKLHWSTVFFASNVLLCFSESTLKMMNFGILDTSVSHQVLEILAKL